MSDEKAVEFYIKTSTCTASIFTSARTSGAMTCTLAYWSPVHVLWRHIHRLCMCKDSQHIACIRAMAPHTSPVYVLWFPTHRLYTCLWFTTHSLYECHGSPHIAGTRAMAPNTSPVNVLLFPTYRRYTCYGFQHIACMRAMAPHTSLVYVHGSQCIPCMRVMAPYTNRLYQCSICMSPVYICYGPMAPYNTAKVHLLSGWSVWCTLWLLSNVRVLNPDYDQPFVCTTIWLPFWRHRTIFPYISL